MAAIIAFNERMKNIMASKEHLSSSEYFGQNVFNDKVMSERLPKDIYTALRKTIDEGVPLDSKIAEVVANEMKEWAIEKGATHFTHWFHPLTGFTAEKHESFITPTADGRALMEFSGRMLAQGETDASSFPSGGLRATFEARGYTTWDCTSPPFLKEDIAGVTLCIPTAFCSYNAEALDEKTPLLRSMEVINKHSLRILRLFGDKITNRVITTVGAEQEYFLIDLHLFKQRKDLVFTGRTLFGAKPPKGQELEDHYYGSIKERIASYMKELDIELWKMGISAKTKHNEVAPAQHELAPLFITTNIAADHNQLIMETMRKVANRHALACLLHEKPFAYINGSGKHNNWSINTVDGQNFLKPGKTPQDNAQFLLFLCAVIKSLDIHADLLRLCAASAANDHRLGACEAPPAIVSIFLGEQLTDILEKIADGKTVEAQSKRRMEFGVPTLPEIYSDSTDRNRTSPFAFTGNKFEFRMLGSSMPIATTNAVLNTIVAESLDEFATRLEKAEDFKAEVTNIIKETYKKHKRIIFNGNGYSEDWLKEAEKRGLPNIPDTVSAIKSLTTKKAIDIFGKYHVFSAGELTARAEIMLDIYIKSIIVEARTMYDMASKEILPACMLYAGKLGNAVNNIIAVSSSAKIQLKALNRLQILIENLDEKLEHLKSDLEKTAFFNGDNYEFAEFIRDKLLKSMVELRTVCDELEGAVSKKDWPFPAYEELLFDI